MKGWNIRTLSACALFAALLSVGAIIRVPMPYIPFTLQTLFVFLAGLVLGPQKGACACALYMALGLFGLPVFASGGGFQYVLHPSFGYILGFIAGAFLTGLLARRRPGAGVVYAMLCCLAGLMVVYVCGVFYLAAILRFHLGQSISLLQLGFTGALVFLPGDALCAFAAAWLYERLPPSVLRFAR